MSEDTQAETDETQREVNVSERKFNGTATLEILVDEGTNKRVVKAAAKRYFKDTHGSRSSRVVAEKDEDDYLYEGSDVWTVMISDHSSGSMADSEVIEL